MKARCLLLFMLFGTLFFTTKTRAAETEPNNTPATANVLPLNGSNTGSISTGTDMDWYKITTTGDGALTLTLTVSNGQYGYFQLFDADGATLLGPNRYTNSTDSYTVDGLAQGTYYVRIVPYDASYTPTYTISNTLAVPAQVNDHEPDSIPSQANVLPLNGSVTGHVAYYYNLHKDSVDWYKLTTNADGAINLQLAVANGNYIYFQLFDADGTTQLGPNRYTNANDNYTVDGLAQGTYYVRIVPYDNTYFGPYTLTNTLIPAAYTNDTEPDSIPSQAITFGLNDSITGHVDYYYNHHKDTVDWYKFTTNADGAINLQLDVPNGNYVYYQLFDADGITQLGDNRYTNSSGNFTTDGLAQGTYYVRVVPYSDGNFAPYKLHNTLIPAAYTNDTEPDSIPSQAITFGLNDSITGHVDYYYNHHKDTVDWYKFTTNADGAINLQLDVPNGNYVYYQLFDADGITQLGDNRYTNSSGNFTTDGLAQGTYYVRVVPYSDGNFAPYKLHNKLIVTGNANDTEPNGTPATAAALPLNDSVTGHIDYYYNHLKDSADWYKLVTTTNGAVNLQLKVANGNFVYYQLFAADGATNLASTYTNGSANYTVDGLGKGTYYVRIVPYNDGSFAPYTLKDTLYTYNPADTIPNEHFAQAATIPVNRTVTGDVGFLFFPVRDTADYWKINYTGTGNMTLTLGLTPTATGGIHYTYFQVYQDTTAAPIFSDYTSGATYQKNFTGLTQGYYYVRVIEYTSSDFNPYSLTLSFTQVNIAAAAVQSTSPSLDTCGGNSITYALSGSHSPYGIQLYRNGVRYDSVNVAGSIATFDRLPTGNYYATVYGDGATDAAYGTSSVTTFLPPTPKNLTTTNIGVHTATLNWVPFSCVRSYRVQYRLSTATTWTTLDDASDAVGTYTLSGLMMYTNYTWRVASVDTAQATVFPGNYSDTLQFRTLSDTAHIVVSSQTNGTTCNSSTIVYALSNSVNPYTVQLYRYGAVYGAAVQATGTATFSSLPTGIYYATATGTGSGGSYGTSGIDTLLPPVPSGLDTMMVTANSAEVTWSPLGCVSYFTIQYRTLGSATWTTLQTNGTQSIDTLTSLLPDTLYEWHLAAVDTTSGTMLMSSYSVSDTFRTMGVLPVTLISFTAKPVNNSVQVNWQTANEINSSYYVVQRSTDGVVFSTIGTVQAGVQHQYSFTDNNPSRGNNYYRLRQVDKNGHYTDSKIVSVNFTGSLLLTLYPNPAVNVVHINLFAQGKATLTIYDNNGKAVMQKVVSDGTTSQQFSVSGLAAGTYTVVLQQADSSHQSTRFVKQ